MKNKFKVGDVVRIRSWEDMEKEFGTILSSIIDCSYHFTPEMKPLCGEEATITYFDDYDFVRLEFKNEEKLNTDFTYSTDMLEKCN